MLFVYTSSVFTPTGHYEVHIYDSEKELYPVAKELQGCNSISDIVEFLKAYHNGLPEKEKLEVKFKIEIQNHDALVTTSSEDPDKFITIFDLLDFYNDVTYELRTAEFNSKPQPVRNQFRKKLKPD